MIKIKKVELIIAVISLTIILMSINIFAAQQMVEVEKYKKEPPYKVAFDIYYKGNAWGVLLDEEFKAEAERQSDLISNIFYTDSEGDTAKQISNIEDLIVQDPDLLIITPNSYTALVPVIEEAYNKGIVVVLMAAGADTDNYTAYVNVDDFECGALNANWLVETIGYKGNVVGLLGIAGVSTAEDRWKGALSVFEKYPDIKIIASEYTDWTITKGKIAMENIAAAHPVIDGIWTGSGAVARGAIEALVSAGLKVPPISATDENGFLKMWKKYDLTAYGYAKPAWLSQKGLQIGLDILQGNPVAKVNIIPSPIVNQDNIDDLILPDLPDSLFTNTHLSMEKIKELFPAGE